MSDHTQLSQAPVQPEQAPVQPAGVVFVEQPKNGLAVASMVLGIIAVLFVWIPFLNTISLILAVIAIGLGIPALIKANKVHKGMGQAIAGLVLALVSAIGFFAVNAATVDAIDDTITEINAELDATDEISVQIGDVTSSYGSSEVPVTITNTSEETQTFFVTIVAESPDGSTQYDSTTVVASDLKPGQSATETGYFIDEIPADAVLYVSDAM